MLVLFILSSVGLCSVQSACSSGRRGARKQADAPAEWKTERAERCERLPRDRKRANNFGAFVLRAERSALSHTRPWEKSAPFLLLAIRCSLLAVTGCSASFAVTIFLCILRFPSSLRLPRALACSQKPWSSTSLTWRRDLLRNGIFAPSSPLLRATHIQAIHLFISGFIHRRIPLAASSRHFSERCHSEFRTDRRFPPLPVEPTL